MVNKTVNKTPNAVPRNNMAKKLVRAVETRERNKMKQVVRQPVRKAPAAASPFGPVATIDTAPVSMGNTIQGCSPIIVPTRDGIRVKGRDYLLTLDVINNASATWTVCGACPITPSCLAASVLKSYNNMYGEYMVHGCAFHFITSSPTSSTGSMLLHVAKDRAGPGLITSSTNMLPFVLSDENSVLTPVWKNASALYFPAPVWRTTGLGNDEDLRGQAPGELFVVTNANSANRPGYVIMDYDISFREHQVNIKSLTFPMSRMKYTQVALSRDAFASVALTTVILAQWNIKVLLDGVTQSAAPTGTIIGDVYKCIMNATNAGFTSMTVANFMSAFVGNGTYTSLLLTDGFVLYAVQYDNNTCTLHPTYEEALAGANPLRHNVTGTCSFYIPAYISYVGSVGNTTLQANY